MGLPQPQAWLLGLPTAVVYGSLALFTSILHNVFLLYYVDTFVSVYKINKVAFWVGETVFLLWNSLNDPLFGWLSDRKFLSSQPGSGTGLSSRAVVLARVRALGWHGPLLALSFLAFWVHWAPAGLQFLLCLCLYDGFLTLVDLHHHALLADLALSAHDRTHLNFYCSLFSAAGSLSVFASYPFWNKEDFSSFRAFCVALAAGSALGFLGATRLLRRRVEAARREPGCSALAVDGGVKRSCWWAPRKRAASPWASTSGSWHATKTSCGSWAWTWCRSSTATSTATSSPSSWSICCRTKSPSPLAPSCWAVGHCRSCAVPLTTWGPSSFPRHLLCRSPSQQPLLPAPVPSLGRLRRGAGALPPQAGPQPAHAGSGPGPPWPALLLHRQVCPCPAWALHPALPLHPACSPYWQQPRLH
ncbi:transmembrane protein 180 isoform X5 [Oryctolagus cuniculus]|uniref:transmembrane protein 180 isoform X5 n=1 Tax=Oryctolagus cuniculus TaxID=9986 RepID=UPI003879F98E